MGFFAKTTDGKVIPTRDYSDIENLMAVTYAYNRGRKSPLI